MKFIIGFIAYPFVLFFCFSSFAFANEPHVKVITDGLNHPWSLARLPDGRFLVTERSGTLRIVSPTGNISPPLDGLPAMTAVGQGGLLDVILHPNFSDNKWIYISYVAGSAVKGYSTEVVRARLENNRLYNVQSIFVALPKTKGGRHFGSRLVFDNDQYLYISLGDRGVRSQAQDLSNHHGSIVRLHDDGRVPKDNPFVDDDSAKPEIFSYGHRNVQGLALHLQTGELWAHEHGPQGGDELNRIMPGKNYGWPTITYGVNYGIGTKIGEGTAKPGLEQPQYFWDPSIAPSGLASYQTDRAVVWLVGALKYQLLAILEPQQSGKKSSPLSHFSEARVLEKQLGRIRDVKVYGQSVYLLTDAKRGKLIQLFF